MCFLCQQFGAPVCSTASVLCVETLKNTSTQVSVVGLSAFGGLVYSIKAGVKKVKSLGKRKKVLNIYN